VTGQLGHDEAPIGDPFAAIGEVADALLYEGYVLYPYRASSGKNTNRWQFGVLMPPGYVADDPSERSGSQTEIVLEADPGATLRVRARFLHAQHRTGGDQPDWDEAVDRQIEVQVPIAQLWAQAREWPFTVDAESTDSSGVHREARAIAGAIVIAVTDLPGPFGARRLTVRVENRTTGRFRGRDDALRSALVAAHTFCALDPGRFLSMTDPPEWAALDVAGCQNDGTWPVLGSSSSVMLSSPIILGDNPQIAPESPGALYDATEIDEILTLRTMTLTDAEKDEARATDPRAAAVIDQVDTLPPDHLDRLHGAVRYLRQVTGEDIRPDDRSTAPSQPETFLTPGTPWWDPGADRSVSPETDAIVIDGVRVARGSKVRLRPGARHTDAQDMFLAGRPATVQAVFFDVDGEQHLGVTPDDDEEWAEIQRWHGRYLYFAPDEVEPIDVESASDGEPVSDGEP
jgi:hypothetical protein